jgi:hypothetical protein
MVENRSGARHQSQSHLPHLYQHQHWAQHHSQALHLYILRLLGLPKDARTGMPQVTLHTPSLPPASPPIPATALLQVWLPAAQPRSRQQQFNAAYAKTGQLPAGMAVHPRSLGFPVVRLNLNG